MPEPVHPLAEPRPVDGFGPGFFRVAGQVIRGPMLLAPDRVAPWAGLDDTGALLALAGKVDLLVLGTGSEMALPPADMVRALAQVGLAVEPMATEPALRSFNLLLGDGRRIALAALPV